MVGHPPLSLTDGVAHEHTKEYRSIVGALQYVGFTQPDIAFSVNKVSQFLQNPLDKHWKAVKRILCYLRGTLDYGLLYSPAGHQMLTGFSDADWGSSIDDRRSTTGYCVFLGGNLVAWSSKKQHVVSRSTTEAEYRSLADVIQEVLWIKGLISELGVQSQFKPVIWCDNTSTIALASNPVLRSKTKHLELDLHFTREKVVAGQVNVNFVPASQQIVDGFTKPLTGDKFILFRNRLGVLPQKLSPRIHNIEDETEHKSSTLDEQGEY
ncbi:hypothetical protein MTR67_011888 [Solanum verrucosum]|uniref:Uncharacterized protein n=1 Tax=Solanum verrucosum TaxID=315347 RepID=A0AAF0TJN3_SOLVR|nr:hypothetical protein MTR67_011888 [Solanum verrucosum]